MILIKLKNRSRLQKPSKPLRCVYKTDLSLLVTLFFVAFAQVAEASELKKPSLEIQVDHISAADVDESSPTGEVTVTTTGGTASIPFQLTEKSNLTLELSGNRIFYDWNDIEKIEFSNGRKPWDDFNSARARFKFDYKWNPKWSSFANIYTAAGWEEEMDDAYSYGASIGVVYKGPYSLNWTLGANSGEGPENGYWGVFGSVAWNQHKKEEGRPGFFASVEFPPAAEFGGVINENWLVRWNLWQTGNIFRLADDNDVSPSGLVVTTVERTGISAEYKPVKKFVVTLGGSYVFGHRYEIQNENGNKIQSFVNINASLGVALNFKYEF
jgi:hypothetical protein